MQLRPFNESAKFQSYYFINLFVLCLNLQLRWKDFGREDFKKDKTQKFPSKLQMEIFLHDIHFLMFLVRLTCFFFLLFYCFLVDHMFLLSSTCFVMVMPKHFDVVLVKKKNLFMFSCASSFFVIMFSFCSWAGIKFSFGLARSLF